MRYLVGSNLLGLTNNKDIDYLEFCEECDYKFTKENGNDVIYVSYEELLQRLKFKKDFKQYAKYLIINYQFDKDIIGQDFPINYHILDYKENLLNLLIQIIDNKWLNVNKRISVNKGHCSKLIYHIAYNVFILKNNSPIITPEQKEIIQRLHDRETPISFIDELIEMIVNLKEDTNNETGL